MSGIIVDTCIWSFALRGKSSRDLKVTDELTALIKENRAKIIGLIRQEILSGYSDLVRYEKLDFLSKLFSNSNYCIELLENFELMAREKLFFIYRIRNKIVHDANSKKTATSNYYLNFIRQASLDILFEFIRKRNNLNLKSANDIFNEIVYDFDTLKIDIKENGAGILLYKYKWPVELDNW